MTKKRTAMEIQSRLGEFLALKEGWLEGEGKAITPAAIAAAVILLQPANERPEFPPASIYPTPEGGVQAEWVTEKWLTDVNFPPEGLPARGEATPTDSGLDAQATIRTVDELVRFVLDPRSFVVRGGADL